MEFTREDTPTIMDGVVVRYRCGDFEINASRNGISTNGFMPMIRQQEDLDTVCEYMRRAFRQYVALSSNSSSMRSYASPLPESVFEVVENHANRTSIQPCGCYPEKMVLCPRHAAEPIENRRRYGS